MAAYHALCFRILPFLCLLLHRKTDLVNDAHKIIIKAPTTTERDAWLKGVFISLPPAHTGSRHRSRRSGKMTQVKRLVQDLRKKNYIGVKATLPWWIQFEKLGRGGSCFYNNDHGTGEGKGKVIPIGRSAI